MTIKTPTSFVAHRGLRFTWDSVLLGSAWTGDPGITHVEDVKGTHVLEWRDEQGVLRGVVAVYASRWATDPDAPEDVRDRRDLVMITDPAWRRRGICTALLTEAARVKIPIDFEQQAYTRAGWRAVRRFLASGEGRAR